MSASSPPKRPALRARYERRKQALVARAAQLFAEHGYGATSMNDLAETTEMTGAALYHYVDDKEQLLLLICEELMDPLLRLSEEAAAGAGAPEEKLQDLLRAWLLHYQAHYDHVRVVSQERPTLERESAWLYLREKRSAFEHQLDTLLGALRSGGTLSSGDPLLVRSSLIAMVDYTPQWNPLREPADAIEVADGYWRLITGRPAAAT
ncbi:MAG: TetR/AcrR family transcriptional regulator [Actinobacteria bacterium]|nr:TetR/AcrR family transcriptional regulator [Actinomycetota bacterium]